jgi:hypothetical protein
MEGMNSPKKSRIRHLLNRGNLRNLVILVSAGSALLFPTDLPVMIAGLVALAVGCALHVLVKGVLIRNTVLCKGGIYDIVRNPYYLSNYLIDSSFCLLSGNIYLLFIYPFLFFWAYGPAFREEDELLHSIYGPDFAKYAAETPQVFPSADSMGKWSKLLAGFSKTRLTFNEFKRVFRFASIGALLMLLHDLSEEGLREVIFWARSHVWPKPNDYDGIDYLALFVVFAVISLVLPRKAPRVAAQ